MFIVYSYDIIYLYQIDLNTESTSQRGVREETLKKCQCGNGLKNIKKISFDAPFSCDSENHNRNLIELRERKPGT